MIDPFNAWPGSDRGTYATELRVVADNTFWPGLLVGVTDG